MVLEATGQPLQYKSVPVPEPQPEQVLVKIQACGVCRTDLHVADGELPDVKPGIIPGHEIIGTVVKKGSNVTMLDTGDLVGIPWLGYTCGECKYCRAGKENLCEQAKFTGYTINGGYAEYTVAWQQYSYRLSDVFKDPSKAPLLCAGLIGYRSYNMTGNDAERIGIYGFGGAAHILTQIAVQQGKEIYAFTRDNDTKAQHFAKELGAVWAGGSSDTPPEKLDAAIIFAPVGALVPKALSDTDKGGVVVCGGIHMSDIPQFPYNILWEERVLRSVANLTRQDAVDFLNIVAKVPVATEVHFYPLEKANKALNDLRNGVFNGAAVLVM